MNGEIKCKRGRCLNSLLGTIILLSLMLYLTIISHVLDKKLASQVHSFVHFEIAPSRNLENGDSKQEIAEKELEQWRVLKIVKSAIK